MTKFDMMELLLNLQADINSTILNTTLNASKDTTKEENANAIQQRINAIMKEYTTYIANKD